MMNRLIFSFLILLALLSGTCLAQQTRSLEVNLQLEQAYDQALVMEVSVRNHGFVVVPPALTILRPILSSVTKTVVIPADQLNVSINIEGILSAAIDYSIRFHCISCASSVPTQFFTADGTSLGLFNAAYIDPEQLPASINVPLQTLGFIAGQVVLANGESADRSVRTTVRLFDSDAKQLITSQPVTIAAGDSRADYRFNGLARSDRLNYLVELDCANCGPNRQLFAIELDSFLNHLGIDFLIQERLVSMSDILYLLLAEEKIHQKDLE